MRLLNSNIKDVIEILCLKFKHKISSKEVEENYEEVQNRHNHLNGVFFVCF